MDISKDTEDATNPRESHAENEELLKNAKIKVKKQIAALEKLISDMEFNLNTRKFGEYEIDKQPLPVALRKKIADNNDEILQCELSKLQGIFCAKSTIDQYIFNFSSSSNYKSPYACQFLVKDNRLQVGKWILPWGIHIDLILKESPLNELTMDVELADTPFPQTCKRHIDCHANRKKQFEALEKSVSSIKNIKLSVTLGFRTVHCRLLNVRNKSTDENMDLTITLSYDSGTVRPNSVRVESVKYSKPSEEMMIGMASFARSFHNLTLHLALEQIENLNHPMFKWTREESVDTLIETTDSEASIETLSDEDSRKLSRKRKRRQKKPTIKLPPPDSDKSHQKTDESLEKSELELEEDLPVVTKKQKQQTKKSTVQKTKKLKANPKQKVPIQSELELEEDLPVVTKTQKQQTRKSTGQKTNKLKGNPKQKVPIQSELSFKGVPLAQPPKPASEVFKKPKTHTEKFKKAITSTPRVSSVKNPAIGLSSPSGISPILKPASPTETRKKGPVKKQKK